MDAEIVSMTEAAIGFLTATGLLGYFWRRQYNIDQRLLDTYSKDETDQQIALHTKPMQEAVVENTKAVRELTGTLMDVRLGMVEVRTDVKHIKAEQGGKTEG